MCSAGQSVTEAASPLAACANETMQGIPDQDYVKTDHRQAANAADTTQSKAQQVTSSTATLHAWQADATQYATVEEWFHSLVRTHFKGSLKVELIWDCVAEGC